MATYTEHAREALQVIEHTLHHLDLERLDAGWTLADLDRFERNLAEFKLTYRTDRERADEAWDLLVAALLALIEGAGDGSAELEAHRDDLIALSEDWLGTHHNRDGYAGEGMDREGNPSKTILNRRRAILWAVIRKALENAPPGVDRFFVEAALGPIVEQLVNPPKPAKAAKAVKPPKPLKNGEIGETDEITVLRAHYPSDRFEEAFRQARIEPPSVVNGFVVYRVKGQRFGFRDKDNPNADTRKWYLVEGPRPEQYCMVDGDTGSPLVFFPSPKGLPSEMKKLLLRTKGEWFDYFQVLQDFGSWQDALERGWDATKRLIHESRQRQRLDNADTLLVHALLALQREVVAKGSDEAVPDIAHQGLTIGDALDFLRDFAFKVCCGGVSGATTQPLSANRLALVEAIYRAAAQDAAVVQGEPTNSVNWRSLATYREALQRGLALDADAQSKLTFLDRGEYRRYIEEQNAILAKAEQERQRREREKAEEAARYEAYLAAEAEELKKPEEAAFRSWIHWLQYSIDPDALKLQKALVKVFKLNRDLGVHTNNEWIKALRAMKIELSSGLKGVPPLVQGTFLEAAKQLKALDAKVEYGGDDKTRTCSFVIAPGTRASAKAKVSEGVFWLFDFMSYWNTREEVLAARASQEAERAAQQSDSDLHLTREENPARERVVGGRELIGQKVTVYRNLHLDTFSVRLGTKVVLHSDWVKLRDAKFVVQAGGRDTVRRTGSKLVHAYIGGILEDFADEGEAPEAPTLPHPIGYNPYRDDTFVARDSGEAAYTAQEVELLGTRAYAKGLNGRVENPASRGFSGMGLLAGALVGAFVTHRLVTR